MNDFALTPEELQLERDRHEFNVRAHALRIAADLALKDGYSAETELVVRRAGVYLAFLERRSK